MNGSNAVAARFLRAVVTGVEGVMPGAITDSWFRPGHVSLKIGCLVYNVDMLAEVDLKAYLKEGCQPGKVGHNGRYRCRLELPFPMAANGFEPSAQRERRVTESGLQKVAGEFAGIIVAAVEASKRERGPRLVVDNTVGSET